MSAFESEMSMMGSTHRDEGRVVGLTRREVIAGSAGVMAGAALGVAPRSAAQEGGSRRRVLRIAHLTDVHVQPEREAGEGFATALKHVQEQADRPDLVFFGGDNLMNVDGSAGAERADAQLKTWNDALKNELSLPHRICIGNHDILRLNPKEGKQWAMDAFELEAKHYTYDQAGWRFIVLDSTSPRGGGYKGNLGDEQFEWLRGVLEDTPASLPVLVLSHIPIIAACAYFDGENEKTGNWVVPGAWMHTDARKIKDLFRAHPNVKVCLSGHIHLADQVRYNDVLYCCNGAVSGGWWGGPYQEFTNGYGLVNLYSDGSAENEFVHFEWTPRD